MTDDPDAIGPVDIVMFCVKLWDTESAARSLLPVMRPTGVISFQNGVQKDDMLRPILGEWRYGRRRLLSGPAISWPGVIAPDGRAATDWCSGGI